MTDSTGTAATAASVASTASAATAASAASAAGHGRWLPACQRADLVAHSGVVAWLRGRQVALFYVPDEDGAVYAIGNHDPCSGANVLGRGILGRLQGQLVVASPLYKQHFRLADGGCIEAPGQQVPVWPARLAGERVEVYFADADDGHDGAAIHAGSSDRNETGSVTGSDADAEVAAHLDGARP